MTLTAELGISKLGSTDVAMRISWLSVTDQFICSGKPHAPDLSEAVHECSWCSMLLLTSQACFVEDLTVPGSVNLALQTMHSSWFPHRLLKTLPVELPKSDTAWSVIVHVHTGTV